MTTAPEVPNWNEYCQAWVSSLTIRGPLRLLEFKRSRALLQRSKDDHGKNNKGYVASRLYPLSKERSFCLAAAKHVRAIYGKVPQLQAYMKSDQSPVTAVDVAIQGTLFRKLSEAFSDDMLIAEEDIAELITDDTFLDAVDQLVDFKLGNLSLDRSQKKGTRWWTLDPIDGTKGLLSGGDFAVGLALHHTKNRVGYPVLGSLMLPRQGVLLLANVLASKLEIIPLDSLGLASSSQVLLDRSCAKSEQDTTASPHNQGTKDWHFSGGNDFSLEGQGPWKPLCCGSLVKYAAVAQGKAFALVQTLSHGFANSWDHAAGIAAVWASGGAVTDEYGNDFAVGSDEDPRVVRLQQGSKAIVASARGRDHLNLCSKVRYSLQHL
ncbi:unnamed protein product [Agarophyton chilense]